jgi:hypothetical protein
MVTQVNPSEVERLPITIQGAANTSLSPARTVRGPAVRISDVQVKSESSWTSSFGGAAARELLVTVHNNGSSAVRPLVVAQWTDGSDHYVITSPPAKLLVAGRSMQITAVFHLSTFASGRFIVVGNVTGDGFQKSFATSTATTPWGLYVIGMLIAIGFLLAVAAFIGRRNGDRNQEGDEPIEVTDYRDQIATLPSQIGALQ